MGALTDYAQGRSKRSGLADYARGGGGGLAAYAQKAEQPANAMTIEEFMARLSVADKPQSLRMMPTAQDRIRSARIGAEPERRAPAEVTGTGGVSMAVRTDDGDIEVGRTPDLEEWIFGQYQDVQGGRGEQIKRRMRGAQAPVKAAASGAVREMTLGLIRPGGDDYQGSPAAEFGAFLSNYIPYLAAYKGALKVFPIAKSLGLMGRTARAGLRGAGIGALMGTLRAAGGAAHDEGFDWKVPAEEAALFGVFDLLGPAGGAVVKKVRGAVRGKKYEEARQLFETAAAKLAPEQQAATMARVDEWLAGIRKEHDARAVKLLPGPAKKERPKLEFRDEVVKIEGDRTEMLRVAQDDSKRAVGFVNFTDEAGVPTVTHVEVAPGMKRKGVGSALMERVEADYPGVEVGRAAATDEGAAFLDAYDARKGSVGTDFVLGEGKQQGLTRRKIEQARKNAETPERHLREGRRVYIQLAKHKKPHRAKITSVVEDADGRVVKVAVQYPGTTMEGGKRRQIIREEILAPDEVAVSEGVKAMEEYHRQLRSVPVEMRARVRREAGEFDNLLRENLDEVLGYDEIMEIYGRQTRIGARAESIAENEALQAARERMQDVLGVEDLSNPVARSRALDRARAMFDRRPDAGEIPLSAESEPYRVQIADDAAEVPFSMAGGLYGFEQDEEGNVSFDPKKALLGLGAGLAMAKYAGKGKKALKKVLAGEIPTKPTEPILSAKQAQGTFKFAIPEMTIVYEAPGAANMEFRATEGARYLRDISGFAGQARDPFRNLEAPFRDKKTGRLNPFFDMEVLRPFENAKGRHIEMMSTILDDYTATVEKQFNIRPYTDEDRAVMDFGEGLIEESKVIEIFGVARAADIKGAERFYRGQYERLLAEVNAVRKLIWPNNPKKLVPHRKDYFHHFNELTGFEALVQVMETPAGIEPAFSGVSAWTRPKGRYLGFQQPRVTDRTTRSAAGGFAKYIQDASYAINIDPQIANLRGFQKALADATGTRFHVKTPEGKRVRTFTDRAAAEKFMEKPFHLETGDGDLIGTYANVGSAKAAITRANKGRSMMAERDLMGRLPTNRKPVKLSMRKGNWEIEVDPGSKNMNNYIEFVNDYADNLAGKTNPADRWFQKMGGTRFDGRKIMRLVTWGNQRVKQNTILANASSVVSQLFNLPQGMALARTQMIPAAGDMLAGIFRKNATIGESKFIRERYFDSAFNKFQTSWLRRAVGLKGRATRPYVKQTAGWMLQALDEVATRWMWHGFHRKAVAEGIPHPVMYADRQTRKMVAGRGVGEIPILQKSQSFQIAAPFQLEVGNVWWCLQDMMTQLHGKEKLSAIATFMLASWVMNRGAEFVKGNKVSFDPIDAVYEAAKVWGRDDLEVGDKALRFGGRVAGEVFSNVPGGQTLAAAYPEYGDTVFGVKLPTRRQLFGSEDPTRFGGGLLVGKAFKDPVFKMLPPFGGVQLKKTIGGIRAVRQGKVTNRKGKKMYDLEDSPANSLRAVVFGAYSTPEAREYFDKQYQPKQQKLKSLIGSGR